jgi:hypothetical protein
VNAWGKDGQKTAADPCPPGWRVPSPAQWKSLDDTKKNPRSYISGASGGLKIGNFLFLPMPYLRIANTGETSRSWASYQSNTLYASRNVMMVEFSTGGFDSWNGNNGGYNDYYDVGMPVRCVAE